MEELALTTGNIRGAALFAGAIAIGGLLLAGIIYVLITRPSARRAQFRQLSAGSRWLGTGFAMAVLFVAMVLAHGQYWGRFFSMRIEPSQLVLEYPWPTGTVVLARAKVQDVRTVPDGRWNHRALVVDVERPFMSGQLADDDAAAMQARVAKWWQGEPSR